MEEADSATSKRRRRADGERNRARILAAASVAFGGERAPSLDRIARDAQVGIGTLYRHFANRDALLQAVYREETDALIGAAARLSGEMAAATALRTWLGMFIDFLDAKRGLADALQTLVGGPDALYDATALRLVEPIDTLVSAAAREAGLTLDFEPIDLLRALAGVASLAPDASWRSSTGRMKDLLLDGLGL